MKRFHIYIVFALLIVCTFSCKQKGADEDKSSVFQEKELLNKSEIDPLEEIDREQQQFLDSVSYYVMATNGLSLRKEPSLESERILTIPIGEKLKMTEVMLTADMAIDNIKGSMVAVDYQGKRGYVYSGYITEFYIPKEQTTTEEYLKIATKNQPDISHVQKDNDPDFHEGYNSQLTLPGASWPETFYISKALYGIPDSINFPNPSGTATEAISQADKEKEVWTSDFYLSRSKTKLDTIHYVYRAEGFGWQVKIFETGENTMVVDYLAFVD